VNEAKVTPFTVTAGPFILNAATRVPSVLTSESPEMVVGAPQVIGAFTETTANPGEANAAKKSVALTKSNCRVIRTLPL
jgi:hypothetical protein